jgi:hypothetical protein
LYRPYKWKHRTQAQSETSLTRREKRNLGLDVLVKVTTLPQRDDYAWWSPSDVIWFTDLWERDPHYTKQLALYWNSIAERHIEDLELYDLLGLAQRYNTPVFSEALVDLPISIVVAIRLVEAKLSLVEQEQRTTAEKKAQMENDRQRAVQTAQSTQEIKNPFNGLSGVIR